MEVPMTKREAVQTLNDILKTNESRLAQTPIIDQSSKQPCRELEGFGLDSVGHTILEDIDWNDPDAWQKERIEDGEAEDLDDQEQDVMKDAEGTNPNLPEVNTGKTMRKMALEALKLLEAPLETHGRCEGGDCIEEAAFDCVDCDEELLKCRRCICDAHQGLPFHKIRYWNGRFFENSSLHRVGFVWHLNHGGAPCPFVDTVGGIQDMTVADVNGIHDVAIGWCRCANAPSLPEQLLARKVFPASTVRPKTGFTFRILHLFQMLNHVSKTNVWDFIGTITRLTNNVDHNAPQKVYKQFNFVQRQWRAVRARARAGVNNAEEAVQKKIPLILPCVSCPQPGVNLEDNWKENPDSDLIHTVFIGGDGCFRLMRSRKGANEAVNPSLFGGAAMYVPNQEYIEFVIVRGGAPDDQSDISCRHFRAGTPARVMHGHNKAVAGLLGISCIRTGAFEWHGTVDIALGERFVNFDFPLTHVLRRWFASGITRAVISYDIACKYNIHFRDRVTHPAWTLFNAEELKQFDEAEIVWLVPKFHLAAHIEGCADKYSFNWTKNVGRTCGESVETSWANLNGLSKATREMTAGGRKDTITDVVAGLNWTKGVNEASRLVNTHQTAVKLLKKKRRVLTELESAMSPELLQKLKRISEKEGGSQYRPKPIEYPSKTETLKPIQREEAEKARAGQASHAERVDKRSARLTGSVGINMGLEMEMRQQNLRVKIDASRSGTEQQKLKIYEARRKLGKALEIWFATRERLGLQSLARTEYQLRIGQAHDALQKLRNALGLKSFLIRRKYRLASSQEVLTRSESEIDRAARQVKKWQEVYNRTWNALKELREGSADMGMENAWAQLRGLKDEDCIMLSEWLEEHRFWKEQGEIAEAAAAEKGKGRRELPRFWKIQFKTQEDRDVIDETVEEWAVEVIRIEWLHAKASMERFDEEVRLIKAESSRIEKTFLFYANKWKDRRAALMEEAGSKEGSGRENRVKRGRIAGAFRKEAVFSDLARLALKQHRLLMSHDRAELS
ncbi:hypothetical protein M422DRAFT_776014 [Sphaerobolus stellatus SS14]|nr:hypothetical protein M422DRAFT_776014 [Sphaerobolus stellatus SS14]